MNSLDAHTVIRYNGGAQAGHNVVAPNGLHHCFSQFGSGTLIPGVSTYLSQFMFIDPLRLVSEDNVLIEKGIEDAITRLIISKRCPVITPFHKFTGQLRELARGADRHGSCGMGVGEAMSDFEMNPRACLYVGDLANPDIVVKKLRNLQRKKLAIADEILKERGTSEDLLRCREEINSEDLLQRCCNSYSAFSSFPVEFDDGTLLREILERSGTVVFEGAQGALLDKSLGDRPYVTKSDCSLTNADRLLLGFEGKIIKLGISRGYSTRHGNGPFLTENIQLTEKLPEWHNSENTWQGRFRVGWLNLVALKYAIHCVLRDSVNGIVLTNLDRLRGLDLVKVCDQYGSDAYKVFQGECPVEELPAYLKKELPVPVISTSWGPTSLDKEDAPGVF